MIRLPIACGDARASARLDCLLTRSLGVYAFRGHGVTVDTRYILPSWAGREHHVLVVFVAKGAAMLGDRPLQEGGCFVLSTALLGRDGATRARSTTRGLELLVVRVPVERVAIEGLEPGSFDGAASFEGLRTLLDGGTMSDEDVVVHARPILETLRRAGWLGTEAFERALLRHDMGDALPAFVRFVGRAFSGLDRRPTLEDVIAGAGLSAREIHRRFTRLQAAVGVSEGGWRDTVRRLRVQAALVLLSAHELPLGDVALLSGYASLRAMGNALQKEGFPSPSVLRRALVI